MRLWGSGHVGAHLLKLLALLPQLLQHRMPGFLLLHVREDVTVEAGGEMGFRGSHQAELGSGQIW